MCGSAADPCLWRDGCCAWLNSHWNYHLCSHCCHEGKSNYRNEHYKYNSEYYYNYDCKYNHRHNSEYYYSYHCKLNYKHDHKHYDSYYY